MSAHETLKPPQRARSAPPAAQPPSGGSGRVRHARRRALSSRSGSTHARRMAGEGAAWAQLRHSLASAFSAVHAPRSLHGCCRFFAPPLRNMWRRYSAHCTASPVAHASSSCCGSDVRHGLPAAASRCRTAQASARACVQRLARAAAPRGQAPADAAAMQHRRGGARSLFSPPVRAGRVLK